MGSVPLSFFCVDYKWGTTTCKGPSCLERGAGSFHSRSQTVLEERVFKEGDFKDGEKLIHREGHVFFCGFAFSVNVLAT